MMVLTQTHEDHGVGSLPQYNASLDKLNSILHRNSVNILKKSNFLNNFPYLCTQKRASLLTLGHQCKHHGPRLTADLSAERLRNCSRSAIKETPILYGEDARRFEARMKERRRISPEERAEMKVTYEALKSVCDFM